jgi:hypothetical protein
MRLTILSATLFALACFALSTADRDSRTQAGPLSQLRLLPGVRMRAEAQGQSRAAGTQGR